MTDFLPLKKRDTVHFQYSNMSMHLKQQHNISAALIKEQQNNVKSYNTPITITANGGE